ncbi:MAG: 5'/3'-nucleotidase SurE [Planctomycetes bacterium]|nr:5'/3'-nucleotidase SurE [Planctomycetota bacterium]
MHILLTNDDGISAPGLLAIYKQLRTIAEVTVIAPQDARSGAGHSISLDPITYSKIAFGDGHAYSVDGTPADCVKLAVNAIAGTPIDMVVSGINAGANVGIHIYYSGTVAAAVEAAFYNIPAIALSAVRTEQEQPDFEIAAEYSLELIKKLTPAALGNVININIPDLTEHKPKGVAVVPHSTNGFDENYSSKTNTDGLKSLTFEDCQHRDNDVVGLDTNSLADGFITITSLHCDRTDYQSNLLLEQVDFDDISK